MPDWRARDGHMSRSWAAATSQVRNDRYLRALASVEDATSLGELTARLCRPVKRDCRRARPLNPHAPDDTKPLEAISRGEFTINGFRNRDLRGRLSLTLVPHPSSSAALPAAVSRKLALLRAHGVSAFVKGGVSSGRAFIAFSCQFFDQRWVYFALIRNWEDKTETDPKTVAAFAGAASRALTLVVNALAA